MAHPSPLILLSAAAFPFLPGKGFGADNPCLCNALALYAHHPARPFLVDPLGRRLGTDPRDGVFHNEMGALHSVGDPAHTNLPTSQGKRDPHPVRYIHLRPMRGRYSIQAVGVASGRYRLEIVAIRGDCIQQTTLHKGNTRKGQVDAYSLDYRDGSGDTVPPVTRSDYREGTWLIRRQAAIRLRAEDTCSGLARTWVKAEGGEEVEPGVIDMHREGESSLEYWSMDNAGNEEARRKVTVRCDFTPPTVVHDHAAGKVAVAPVEIRFRAFDAVSGPAALHVGVVHVREVSPLDMRRREFRLSGDRLRLREPGTYRLHYHAVDSAGNRSAGQVLELEVRKQSWLKRWLTERGPAPAGP